MKRIVSFSLYLIDLCGRFAAPPITNNFHRIVSHSNKRKDKSLEKPFVLAFFMGLFAATLLENFIAKFVHLHKFVDCLMA